MNRLQPKFVTDPGTPTHTRRQRRRRPRTEDQFRSLVANIPGAVYRRECVETLEDAIHQ